MCVKVSSPWGSGLIHTPLIGDFNVSNLLAVTAALGLGAFIGQNHSSDGKSPRCSRPDAIVTECASVAHCVADYAHTLVHCARCCRHLGLTSGKVWCIWLWR